MIHVGTNYGLGFGVRVLTDEVASSQHAFFGFQGFRFQGFYIDLNIA